MSLKSPNSGCVAFNEVQSLGGISDFIGVLVVGDASNSCKILVDGEYSASLWWIECDVLEVAALDDRHGELPSIETVAGRLTVDDTSNSSWLWWWIRASITVLMNVLSSVSSSPGASQDPPLDRVVFCSTSGKYWDPIVSLRSSIVGVHQVP